MVKAKLALLLPLGVCLYGLVWAAPDRPRRVAKGTTSAEAPLPKTEQRAAMLVIPAGSFLMGSPASEERRSEHEQQHEVKLTRGFWLGQTEVTQGQWDRVMGTSLSGSQGKELPVDQVSWLDTVSYCNRLSKLEGLPACYKIHGEQVDWVGRLRCGGYRLPTEAEWEYAARAGQTTTYSGSDTLDDVAWYCENSGVRSANGRKVYDPDGNFLQWVRDSKHPVGQKKANSWGLYDMSGSVFEAVWDWYGAYSSGTVVDPTGPGIGEFRLGRGGDWTGLAQLSRVAYRGQGGVSQRYAGSGLRVARSLP